MATGGGGTAWATLCLGVMVRYGTLLITPILGPAHVIYGSVEGAGIRLFNVVHDPVFEDVDGGIMVDREG